MSKIWIPAGGGGSDTDPVTALAADVRKGKVIVDKDGNPLTGTLPDKGAWSSSELAAGASVAIPYGIHNGQGKVTAKSLAAQTAGTLAANRILSGYKGWSNGALYTGTIPSRGAATITPGTSNQTAISAGYYASGNVIVAGDSKLLPANIKKGVTIFGKRGTFEGYITSPLYIYNKGVWGGVQTTGVQPTTPDTSSYESGGAITVETKRGGVGGGSSCLARLNQTINLSAYNYLKVNFDSTATLIDYAKPVIGISTNQSITAFASLNPRFEFNQRTGLAILNISSVTGNYYIYFGLYFLVPAVSHTIINQIFLANS